MVTIGMALRRLVAACMFAMLRDKMQKLFDMEQLAIAIPNGAELTARTVSTLLNSLEAMQEELELMDGDVKDAFHAPQRGMVWELVKKHFPEWQRFYELSWHGTTVLRANGHVINMHAGFFMGMPDASLLFALSLFGVIRQLTESGLVKMAMIYADNLDFVVQRSRGKELATELLRLLEEAHLQLKADVKILPLYSKDGVVATGPADDYKPEGAKIKPERVDNIRLLGTVVSHDDKLQLEDVRGKLQDLLEVGQRITRIGDAQCELIMLRYVFLSRTNFILRNCTPSVIRPALEEFDIGARKIISEWLERPSLPESVYQQAMLPGRKAGLGFCITSEMADVAFAASLSSYLKPSQGPALFGEKSEEVLERMRNNPTHNSHNRDAIKVFDTLLQPKILELQAAAEARNSSSTLPFVPPADKRHASKDSYQIISQQQLTQDVHNRRAKRLAEECEYRASRMKMAEAPGATAWLHAMPSEHGLRIAHEGMKRAIRHMLGLSEIQRPVMCRCAKEPVQEQQEPDVDYAGQHKGLLLPDDYSAAVHLTVCKCLGGGIHRHDTLLSLIRVILDSIPGVVTRKEVSQMVPDHRADLIEYSPINPTGVCKDTSVTNPQIDANRKQAGSTRLYAAMQREKAKRKIWEEPCRKAGLAFGVLAFETTGGQGREAQLSLKSWAALADSLAAYEPVNWAAPNRYVYYSQRISVSLVRGQDRAAHNLLSSILRDDSKHINIGDAIKEKGKKGKKKRSPKKKKSDE
jgi:hypothetical protein